MRHVAARPPRPARGEGGETLIETLTTVSILGIVVVGLMASLTTILAVTGTGNDRSRAAVEATSRAEAYMNLPYSVCALSTTYRTATFNTNNPFPNSSYTDTLKVRYLKAANPAAVDPVQLAVFVDTPPGTTPASTTPGCPANQTDQGIQELTVTVTKGRATQTVVVDKRNTTCPAVLGYPATQRC